MLNHQLGPYKGHPFCFSIIEMSQFKTIELDCKIQSLTVSHQFKVVYINFTAFEDIKIEINSEIRQILLKKFEKAKFRLQFGDFSELETLPLLLTNKKIRLSIIVKFFEDKSIVDTVNETCILLKT